MSSQDLLAYQARNRDRTVEKIKAAMAAIEAEIKKAGFYPENQGRVTIKEVCRRAGVGHSTLKNSAHRETVELVRRWLQRQRKTAPVVKADVENLKRQRHKALVEQVETIARHYNRFKIEYDELMNTVASLERDNAALASRNSALEAEVLRLKRQLAQLERKPRASLGPEVVPFRASTEVDFE